MTQVEILSKNWSITLTTIFFETALTIINTSKRKVSGRDVTVWEIVS